MGTKRRKFYLFREIYNLMLFVAEDWRVRQMLRPRTMGRFLDIMGSDLSMLKHRVGKFVA